MAGVPDLAARGSRDPQSWVDNIFTADEDDFFKATHRVYRSADHPSAVVVGVLD